MSASKYQNIVLSVIAVCLVIIAGDSVVQTAIAQISYTRTAVCSSVDSRCADLVRVGANTDALLVKLAP
jgi:hypothetical protein